MVKVVINQGTLIGKESKTPDGFEYNQFIQIPYAKPPLGELRFKGPQFPEKWEGERDASQADINLISFQYDQMNKKPIGSENCLYLNVYTPKLPTKYSKLLPVMVCVHGGGFFIGNGTLSKDCSPDFLIDKNVVVVTINYRLGIFGFLSLDIPDAAGNMGLKDQIMALKWIQNNISEFNGDKDNVTLFGISAGAASIDYILLSPLGKGLCHKAIIQSGSAINHWANNEDIKHLSVKVALELGYQGPDSDYHSIHEYLMKQTTEALSVSFKISNPMMFKGLNFGFAPSIERDFGNGEAFITEYPYNILKEGRFNKVPVIRGYCEFEGLLMAAMKPHEIQEVVQKKNFLDFWHYPLNPNDFDKYSAKFKEVYVEGIRHEDEEQFAIDFFGDFDITSGIYISNKLTVEQGVPTYGYMFAYDGGINFCKLMFKIKQKGACHGDDGAYIINLELPEGVKPTQTDLLIRKRLCTMWTDFAKTSNPTPNTNDIVTISWPPLSNSELKCLIIDENMYIKTPYDPERMAIFEEIYEQYHK